MAIVRHTPGGRFLSSCVTFRAAFPRNSAPARADGVFAARQRMAPTRAGHLQTLRKRIADLDR